MWCSSSNFIDHPEINRTLKELDTKVTLKNSIIKGIGIKILIKQFVYY